MLIIPGLRRLREEDESWRTAWITKIVPGPPKGRVRPFLKTQNK